MQAGGSGVPLTGESEIVRLLAGAATADDAAHDVLATLAGRLGWDVALLWVPGDKDGLLHCEASWSGPDPALAGFREVCERLTFGVGTGLPGRVFAAGGVEWVPEVPADRDFPRAAVAAEAGLRSAAATALPAGGGVIELLARAARAPDEQHERLLRTAAGQLGHYVARVHAEDRLRELEERTRTIIDSALDAIMTMDHNGDVVDVNHAAELTFGYAREQAAGRPLAELIIPEHLRASHWKGLRHYLATGEANILDRRIELDAVRADGTTFPVELTVSRLGSREPPMFVGFMRDITAPREAEDERRRLAARAEAERRRMAFLAQAGLRMAASLDYATALGDVARAAVPEIADLCAVTVLEHGVRPLVLVHADPERERLARAMVDRDPEAAFGVGRVVRSGASELASDRSSLTVPIRASGRTYGAIALSFDASGRRFGEDDLVVATALAARAGLHIENARLYSEQAHVAETLQQSLLPAALPAIPGLELAGRYRAAAGEVGGDFYDVFACEPGVWAAVIGDVSGKGPEAAALTALARHTLYATAIADPSPARNLERLDEAMRRRSDGPAFCTVVFARLCPGAEHTMLTLASGGHPPPLVLRADGTAEWVDVPGTLVGILGDAGFEERDLELRPGDLLLLYTDGAVELRRRDRTFGDRQLEQLARAHAGRPVDELVEALARRVDELRRGATDDVALLALRVTR
jgi:PAS domain S-box-containing protein